MERKLIFFDFDGTIMDHYTNDVSKKTKEALLRLKANGHVIVLATGRAPALFYGKDKELGFDNYIACNGRYVVCDNKIVYQKPINKDVLNKLVETCKKNNIDVAFESDNAYIAGTNNTDFVKEFSDIFHLEVPKFIEDYHLTNNIYQCIVFMDVYQGFDYLKEEFPSLSFHISNKVGLDVNEIGGLKEIGVLKVAEHYGFDIKDTIAFGDGFNDIGMIETVGYGIAMGNGRDELKEKADYVTKRIDEDGVYQALVKLGLI